VPVVVAVCAPPDPIRIARALANRPGLAILASRATGAPRLEDALCSFVTCDPVESCEEMTPPTCAIDSRGWNGLPSCPRWIGVVPYESLRDLERPGWTRDPDDRPACTVSRPAWRRYPAVVRIEHSTGQVAVEADDEASASRLIRALRGPSEASPCQVQILASDEADDAHLDRVREALRLIASGDLYEVNLACRIPLEVRGDPLSLFASLLDEAPAPWGFLQDLGEGILCGASPELAISVRGDVLRTCPIKGTRPRGCDAADDARLAADLDTDAKERAELVMAVDVHRNDLGRVAVPGSVRVLGDPRVHAGRTVWSRGAEVVARLAPGVRRKDVVRALLPCGSVTGAPKVRAMEVIARLEPWRRGAYTGAFGYVGRDGSMVLAMVLRTLELQGTTGVHAHRRACYFAGGGIVADSDPERELQETRWKAVQLSRLGAGGRA